MDAFHLLSDPNLPALLSEALGLIERIYLQASGAELKAGPGPEFPPGGETISQGAETRMDEALHMAGTTSGSHTEAA